MPVTIRLAAWPCWCLIFACGAWAGEPSAEKSSAQKLLRPDSLAGWDYGEGPPAGWTILAGRLTGRSESTPLLSGFSFGDFELRWQWSAAPGAAWRILLPEVPKGTGLEIVLREGPRGGQVLQEDREVAPGGKVEPRRGTMHTAVLGRSGAKLSVEVDGKPLAQCDIAAHRRFGLGLAAVGGEAVLSDLCVQEPPGQPIFNGKDLRGWWTPGKLQSWAVENGELVLAQPGGGNYLRTEKLYGNFTLSLEYTAKKGCNSGIGIRTPRNGWPSGDGMELQIWDRPLTERLDKHACMAIYGNVPPLARADRSLQWNRVVIKADGWMISAWVNGELVQQVNTLRHPELRHRQLAGWIGVQDHGDWIRVRDLRVLDAPEGRGLDAWYRPQPRQAVEAVVERLMDSQVLSAADGITSGVVVKTVPQQTPGQCVLAELSGPGALVRLARTTAEGRLAFYFDGEETPRIECAVADVHRVLPGLSEDAQPALVYLPFQRSLKITLRDGKAGSYRCDWLRFPAELPLDSFRQPMPRLLQSWLGAAAYRCEQSHWGNQREYDSLVRLQGETKGLAPGKTEPLLRVDGAGIVHWLKLRANKKLLETDQLWLEVAVDGEASPAVSAPARFWFPGLAAGGNYGNFVMLDRGGPTCLLAMPFGNGITISARNCGNTPLEGVGVSVAMQPATAETRQQIAGRMRLRGVFQPAGQDQADWIRQEGRGRWVGLVVQLPEGEPAGIGELAVDGQPAEGWAAEDLDLFLGRSGDFRAALSGRRSGFYWRYLLLEPVDFQKSLVLKGTGKKVGDRLAWFYVK